jgi:hypothetical protein
MHLNSMPASQSRSSYESSMLANFPTPVCSKSRFALLPKRKNWMTLHTAGVPVLSQSSRANEHVIMRRRFYWANE